MESSKSTMLDNLPQQNDDDGQQKLVQEILQEIKENDTPQGQQLDMQQQYQMDPNVNMSGPNGQLPSQNEIREMQEMQRIFHS